MFFSVNKVRPIKRYHHLFLWMFGTITLCDTKSYLVYKKVFSHIYIIRSGELKYFGGVDPATKEKK